MKGSYRRVSRQISSADSWNENESLNARLQVLTGGDVAISPDWNHRMAYLETSVGSRQSRERTTRRSAGPAIGIRALPRHRSHECTPSTSCIDGSRSARASGNPICSEAN
jgi:hypothetical protein